MTLKITITDAGRAELIQNSHLGFNAVTIVAVDVGDAQYVPDRAQTTLGHKVASLGSIAGNAVGDGILHITARDESAAAYNVGEFGLITDKGTLFAVCALPASAGWIIQKAAPSIMLLAIDVLLDDIDAEQIQFGNVEFLNPPATTDVAGVVELADDTEAAAAEDNRRALTPRGARKFLDADTTKEPAIQKGTAVQFWRGDKMWADLAAAVRGAVLTGLSTATATAVAATDTLLVALGKLQAQVTSLGTNKLDKTATAVAATKLATARTLTIGSSAKAFDGTGNVSWSLAEIGAQAALGFTPVRQGGGAGQYTNTVHIGWGNTAGLLLQVDATDFANNWPISISKNAATATKLATARTIGGVAFDGTANINLPGVNTAGNQNTSGNAGSATKLATARTLTIGSSAKAFDGTGNVSWSLAEIGAAALNHTHAYLPLTGGTLTGPLTVPSAGSSWISGTAGDTASFKFSSPATTGSWHAWMAQRTAGGNAFAIGVLGEGFHLTFATKANIDAGTNATTQVLSAGANGVTVAGALDVGGIISGNGLGLTNLSAANLIGTIPSARLSGTYGISISGSAASCTGNAGSATKLATPRTINGVNFDGSANITITAAANGGTSASCSGNAATATKLATARTINGVNFDGTANITISAVATAASVMAANAAANVGAVGTYAILSDKSSTPRYAGDTVAGSLMRFSSTNGTEDTSTMPAGTWRCMGRQPSGGHTVFLRIS